MSETVDELKARTYNNPLFVEYHECTFDEDTDEQIIIMEPITLMTLKEYVECYGFIDESTISNILQQIFWGLEALFNISYFHGNLSINNVFIDQNTMAIKLADYGLYN
jgi:RIO-like serine/threonine protein kinase